MRYTAVTFPITGSSRLIELNYKMLPELKVSDILVEEPSSDYANCYQLINGKIQLNTIAGATRITHLQVNGSSELLDAVWIKTWLCEFLNPVYAIFCNKTLVSEDNEFNPHKGAWFGFLFEDQTDAMMFKLSSDKVLSLTTTELTESIFA